MFIKSWSNFPYLNLVFCYRGPDYKAKRIWLISDTELIVKSAVIYHNYMQFIAPFKSMHSNIVAQIVQLVFDVKLLFILREVSEWNVVQFQVLNSSEVVDQVDISELEFTKEKW